MLSNTEKYKKIIFTQNFLLKQTDLNINKTLKEKVRDSLTHQTGLQVVDVIIASVGLRHAVPGVGITGQVEVLHHNPIGTIWDLQSYGTIGTYVHV